MVLCLLMTFHDEIYMMLAAMRSVNGVASCDLLSVPLIRYPDVFPVPARSLRCSRSFVAACDVRRSHQSLLPGDATRLASRTSRATARIRQHSGQCARLVTVTPTSGAARCESLADSAIRQIRDVVRILLSSPR